MPVLHRLSFNDHKALYRCQERYRSPVADLRGPGWAMPPSPRGPRPPSKIPFLICRYGVKFFICCWWFPCFIIIGLCAHVKWCFLFCITFWCSVNSGLFEIVFCMIVWHWSLWCSRCFSVVWQSLSSELDSLQCDGDISRDMYSVWEKHRVISDLCVTAKNVGLAVLLIWPIVGNCELTVSTFMFYVNI